MSFWPIFGSLAQWHFFDLARKQKVIFFTKESLLIYWATFFVGQKNRLQYYTKTTLENFVIGSQCGKFWNMLFLYLYGVPFDAVIVFCSGPDLLFKSILIPCALHMFLHNLAWVFNLYISIYWRRVDRMLTQPAKFWNWYSLLHVFFLRPKVRSWGRRNIYQTTFEKPQPFIMFCVRPTFYVT